MPVNVEGWLKRAQEFDATGRGRHSGEALQFAISMAVAFYGPNSQQVEIIKRQAAMIPKEQGSAYPDMLIYEFALGAIRNMVEEIKAGLTQNIRLGIAGEILADLIGMAREALDINAVEVAAVLTAAAFEM